MAREIWLQSSSGWRQFIVSLAQYDVGIQGFQFAGQIAHRLGTDKIGAPEMLRCARDMGLKAKAYRTDWSRLASTPLPAIAPLRDGSFLLVAKADKEKVLVQSPMYLIYEALKVTGGNSR